MTEFRLTVSAHEHDSEPTNVGEVRITDLSFLLMLLLENQKHGTSACLGGCRYPMLLSGALAAPLRRIDGGLCIDVLARIIVVGLSMKLTSAVLQQRVSSVLCHS